MTPTTLVQLVEMEVLVELMGMEALVEELMKLAPALVVLVHLAPALVASLSLRDVAARRGRSTRWSSIFTIRPARSSAIAHVTASLSARTTTLPERCASTWLLSC